MTWRFIFWNGMIQVQGLDQGGGEDGNSSKPQTLYNWNHLLETI